MAVPLSIESYRHRWPIFLIIVIIHDNYNIMYRVNKCKIDFIQLKKKKVMVGNEKVHNRIGRWSNEFWLRDGPGCQNG